MSKVLLMDDNSVIRNSVGKVLSRMGHEVQCASNGEEAIALYKQAQEHQLLSEWRLRQRMRQRGL